MDESGYQTPFIEGRRRRSPKKRMIVITVIVILLLLGVIGGAQLFATVTNTPASTPTPTPTTIVFPTDTPTPTASPTAAVTPTPTPKKSSIDAKTKQDRAKLRVVVENGSGVAGAANNAAQLLKNAGYTVTGTQNADAFTYEDVTISVKAASASYLPLLREDLSSEYTIGTTNTTLDASASSSADAVVIIGK